MIIEIDDECPLVRAIRLAIAFGGEVAAHGQLIIPGETRLDDFMSKCRELDLFLELHDGFGTFILRCARFGYAKYATTARVARFQTPG